jgi:hypothetical protein
MLLVTYAGWRLTYPQARSWLTKAGIDTSKYNTAELEADMLSRLVNLLEEKKIYPDKVSITPFFDDPETHEQMFVLICMVVYNWKKAALPERNDSNKDQELKKELLESSGFKDEEVPWRTYYQG